MGTSIEPGNLTLEVRPVAPKPGHKPFIEYLNNPDIEVYEWGPPDPKGKKPSKTYRACITRDGQPTAIGWKIINLAIMGKTWRYISRVTGITRRNIGYIFHYNPVMRDALLELEYQIVEEAKHALVQNVKNISDTLVKIALGKVDVSDKKQRVQLEAIREYYNRLGFGAVAGNNSGQLSDGINIPLTVQEGDELAALLVRRREKKGEIANGSDDTQTEKPTASAAEPRRAGRNGPGPGVAEQPDIRPEYETRN